MKTRLMLVAAVAALGVAGLHAQQSPMVRALTEPWPVTEKIQGIEIVPVLKQVYLLVGAGANVTVQAGNQGVVMVDAGAAGKTDALIAAVRHLTSRPIRYLIDTGPDPDHTGGNGAVVRAAGGLLGEGLPAAGGAGGGRAGGAGRGAGGGGGRGGAFGGFSAATLNVGILTISAENAANRLSEGGPGVPAVTDEEAIPESTFFTRRKDIYLNGEPIEILAQPNAHTDGDVFVFFRGSDVVSVGDVFRTDGYPRIDAARGGSIQGEIDGLNAIVDITVPERNQMGGTLVVPGHGHLCNEADVVEYRDMVTILRDRVQDMIKKGMTAEQVKASKPALEYDGLYSNPDWTTDMFLDAIYRDLSKPAQGGGK